MKNITKSLIVIGAVAAIVIGGTIAYFSDTETSTGNTFTAGSIDLKVDSTQHYNNAICTNNVWVLESGATATVPQYPVINSACSGTWGQPTGLDIVGQKFFDFGDVKPGDSGENTVSLHVINNDAYICGYVTNLTNNDNGLTEPESSVDSTDGLGNGELQNNILMTVWKDTGSQASLNGACNNILDPGEQVYVSGVPIDSNTGGWLLGHVAGDKTVCLGVAWNIPTSVGNNVQTDSVTGDISFYTEQYRNNPNFVCPAQLPGGTTPTSSPTIDGVIGTDEYSGGQTYPVTGAIVHAKAVGSNLYLAFDVTGDSTDARSGQNSVGNDGLGANLGIGSVTDTSILITGTDDAVWSGKWNGSLHNSGLTDTYKSAWENPNLQVALPSGVNTKTLYSTGHRVSEWVIPYVAFGGVSGNTVTVGGSIEVPDGVSTVYPVGLSWGAASTYGQIVLP